MLGLALAVGAIVTSVAFAFRLHHDPFNGPTWTVEKQKLVFTVMERGSLESADYGDIICKVKAKSGGGTVATSIRSLVDEGTKVKKGDLVIQLDDSFLVEQLKDKEIKVIQTKNDWDFAESDFQIQLADNDSLIKNAINDIVVAKLDVQKYIGKSWEDDPTVVAGMIGSLTGSAPPHALFPSLNSLISNSSLYQQNLEEAQGNIEQATSDRDGWADRSAWSQRMAKLSYVSKTLADSDQSKLDSAEFFLKKYLTARQILDITKQRDMADLRNKLEQAVRRFDTALIQAEAKKAQKDGTRKANEQIYLTERERKKELQQEIKKCEISAEKDGMVVYFVSEQTRGGFGGKQTIIAQGETVSEGQKLMRIPDLTKMQVNVRVHESMISHVAKEQKATIQIDASPGRIFPGTVKFVSEQPSQADMFAADIKIYQTVVTIDANLQGLKLKPQMSAKVTITARESKEETLTVPIQSVFGSADMDKVEVAGEADTSESAVQKKGWKKRKCFVLVNLDPKERDIEIRDSNDRLVEVMSGLTEGDVVVLNPGPLLTGEKAKWKPGVPKVRVQSNNSSGAQQSDPGQLQGVKDKGGAQPGNKRKQ